MKGAVNKGGPIKSPYSCALTFRTTETPRKYGRALVVFRVPARAIAPDNSWRNYKLVVRRLDGDIMATANCIIPNTPEAIAYMDRRIAHGVGVKQDGPSSLHLGVSTSTSSSPLPTIYVYANDHYWWGAAGGHSSSYEDWWERSYTP